MRRSLRVHTVLVGLLAVVACHPAREATGVLSQQSAATTITLLFTNDVESAYDPIPAFWLDDMSTIGGIAEMTTLIEELRQTEPNLFLFDSGDIFTGALAKLTKGALSFELMITMGYDAMAIGNHEFEYGHEVFAWAKNRAPVSSTWRQFVLQGHWSPLFSGARCDRAARRPRRGHRGHGAGHGDGDNPIFH